RLMSKARVVVVGGGFAGIAAAVAASKCGAQVTLLERTDQLSGAGLRAGQFTHNGKFVACEEAKALGVGELVEALESITLHQGTIVDEEHAKVYHAGKVDSAMRRTVAGAAVELHFLSRVVEVEKDGGSLKAVITAKGERYEGDVFVDASGTFGGMANCIRYGHGCVMCLHRCPFFGDRVSIATKAGAQELHWVRPDGTPGAAGAAIQFFKESLSAELRDRLKKEGAFSIPIPEELIDYDRLKQIGAARGPHEVSHINLVDIGLTAKCVGIGYFPLANFPKIRGFENAQLAEPMAGGGRGYISRMSITPRENSLRARGLPNVFVAGDKAGIGGIAEVIGLGILAGSNATRVALGKEPIELPRTTAIGELIAYKGERMATPQELSVPVSMAYGAFAARMKELGLLSYEPEVIHRRIRDLGLSGILGQRLV
ncbi:MAG: FAD-dependent oxidoreductase, partial [Dehalococcoidia bacterium]|nr:FAD-dependent oxidoreductase [Dehalococcoidia bacterium]